MPDTPEKVKVKNSFTMWLLPVILFFVGIVMIIGAFVG
jgi:paraquat-inducible protein B